MIPFTGFAPDLDPTTPGIITSCTNLVPTLKGYKGGPAGVDAGMSALAAAALSAAIVFKLDGSSRLFAGTTTKLYEKSTTTWADRSRAAAYNASNTYPWRFAQFGDTSLAINKGDVLQSSTTGVFADVVAPKAAVMCVASGFVLLGNTNEAIYSDSPDRWWCSAYLNVADWVTSISTQCTTGRLVDSPGAITGARTLGYDAIFYKAKSMYLARYAGPPGVWDFSLIPGEIGCASQEAIADIGTAHIFIGNDDIYLFNGSLPVSVGAPLREWFFGDLDPANRHLIRHIHDRIQSLVYFHYPRTGGAGVLNGCIVYNYKSNKWGLAHKTIETTIDYVSGGYTWDTLPLTTWDSWPAVSYDSPYWTASSMVPAYFDTAHKIYQLTGFSVNSSLVTGDYGSDNRHSMLSRVTIRYLLAATNVTMVNYYQEVHGSSWILHKRTTQANGRFDILFSAPWHRAVFNFGGDVEVSGLSADFKPAGVF